VHLIFLQRWRVHPFGLMNSRRSNLQLTHSSTETIDNECVRLMGFEFIAKLATLIPMLIPLWSWEEACRNDAIHRLGRGVSS
jgi:hypothetical protein